MDVANALWPKALDVLKKYNKKEMVITVMDIVGVAQK